VAARVNDPNVVIPTFRRAAISRQGQVKSGDRRHLDAQPKPECAAGGHLYLQPLSRNFCRCCAGEDGHRDSLEANEQYYGKPVFPVEILYGEIKPPEDAQECFSFS